jgi:hypothetical protein
LEYPKNIHSFYTIPCLQAHKWSKDIFEQVVEHIGAYDNENEWMLDEGACKSLQHFFLGSDFKPFLIALDMDETRVMERAKLAEEKQALKDFLRLNGHRELARWLDKEQDFDESDLDNTIFPNIPIPYEKMLDLQDLLKDINVKDTTIDLLASSLLDMARYTHAMHFKIDALQSRLGEAASAPEPSQTHASLLVKYPWLSRCDDHVFNLPPGQLAMELARTSAVIACVFASNVLVCV